MADADRSALQIAHRAVWMNEYPSGIIGSAGRIEHLSPAVRSAELRLAGAVLPLVSPARVYICGITPYDVTHLGHAATFVWADAAQSVLRSVGVQTMSCRNVTDVDDVLTSAAGEQGRHYDDYAVYQEFLFEQSMAALRVARPTHSPRARHSVHQVQQLAAALIATGNAYERGGSVFFRGESAVIASGLTRDRARALATDFGDDPDDPARDDPFDVPVWRPSTERDPAWPSPWGWGRPGWHAECAAMAMGTLGSSVDLLVGGADLAFPHHAYQSAMVQASMSVAPFARARPARRRRAPSWPEDGQIDGQPRARRRFAAQPPRSRDPAVAAGSVLAGRLGVPRGGPRRGGSRS